LKLQISSRITVLQKVVLSGFVTSLLLPRASFVFTLRITIKFNFLLIVAFPIAIGDQ